MKKYSYYKIIQQRFANKWEDVSCYETDSSFWSNKEDRNNINYDLKEYRLTGYPTRLIKRREIN